MKKSVTYFIVVGIVSEGQVYQSKCECAAGAGPRAVCKHVAVVCYAILHFKESQKWPLKETVTQKQQVWHLPKKTKIAVSPMKVEDLTYNNEEYGVKKRQLGVLCFDPSPESTVKRKKMTEMVKNQVVNYTNRTAISPGIAGSFKMASSAALYHDHDYLSLRLDEHLVWEKIKVTEEEAKAIEVKTRKQRDCKALFLQRSLRVTAYRVHEICYFTDRRNKKAYAQALVNGTPTVQTKAMLHGIANENHAKKVYSEISGNEVIECGLFVSTNYPFLGASPDGLIARDSLLEVKCPESIKDELIRPSNYKHIGLAGGKHILKKSSYYYQVQTQLFVTGRDCCHFFLWTNVDSCLIKVERDEELMKEIVSKVKDYYNEYIVSELREKWFPSF